VGKRAPLTGEIPSPISPPSGCRFRTRCPYATDLCASQVPEWREISPAHWVACHRTEEVRLGGLGAVVKTDRTKTDTVQMPPASDAAGT